MANFKDPDFIRSELEATDSILAGWGISFEEAAAMSPREFGETMGRVCDEANGRLLISIDPYTKESDNALFNEGFYRK